MTLLVFGNDTIPKSFTAKMRNGTATFSGQVDKPTYAELKCQRMKAPLPFFIENSDITVNINPAKPEASHITGSRSNSLLRYQLEQCSGNGMENCLRDYVTDNPSSPFAAYLTYRYLCSDHETANTLFSILEGDATSTWHYRLLRQHLENMKLLKKGEQLMDFTFINSEGKASTISSLLSDSCHHLILFAATWCKQCDVVEKTAHENYPSINTIRIDIDKEPQGWDAPYMQKLNIEHIPYLILLDSDGRIVANDARIWEIHRYTEIIDN